MNITTTSYFISLILCIDLLCTYQCNPQLPLIWAEVGICITENYNSPPTRDVLAMQTTTKSQLVTPENTRARRGFVRLYGVGLVMS